MTKSYKFLALGHIICVEFLFLLSRQNSAKLIVLGRIQIRVRSGYVDLTVVGTVDVDFLVTVDSPVCCASSSY